MSSIILELQNEASNSNSSVSDLLRKAKIVAVKLGLDDFLKWIENELNGYDTKEESELPSYRIISGEAKAWNPYYGWRPILFSDIESQRLLSVRSINQKIGELDDLMKSESEGPFFVDYNPEAKKAIREAIKSDTDIKFMVSKNSVAGILEGVRNIVLDWSLKLEKEGVMGEGMTFSKEEKEKVDNKDFRIGNIENFNGVIGGSMSGNSSININQIKESNREELKNLTEQIKKYTKEIGLEKKEENELKEKTNDLDASLKVEKLDSKKIGSIISSIKNILEGATGSVVAQGILFSLQKFIGY